MIKLGTRYIDYGLTGGFFLFLGVALFGWLDTDRAVGLLKDMHDWLAKNSIEGFETLINGILASLFIVCVFAAGLLLDLGGSVFILREAELFRRHLRRNTGWLEPLLVRYKDYLGEDVDKFLMAPNWWQLKAWYDFRSSPLWHPIKVVSQMGRIESILLSYLLLTADRTRIEHIVDQIRTCRLARAISSGSFLSLFICFALLLLEIYLGRSEVHSDTERQALVEAVGKLAALNILFVIASGVFFFIILLAYSKFCTGLFSSIYVLLKSEGRENDSKSP